VVDGVVVAFDGRCASVAGSCVAVVCARALRLIARLPPSRRARVM
jgi:hypothetical protein